MLFAVQWAMENLGVEEFLPGSWLNGWLANTFCASGQRTQVAILNNQSLSFNLLHFQVRHASEKSLNVDVAKRNEQIFDKTRQNQKRKILPKHNYFELLKIRQMFLCTLFNMAKICDRNMAFFMLKWSI